MKRTVKRVVYNGELLTKKKMKEIISKNSCKVATVLALDGQQKPHTWEYIDESAEITNIFGEIGLKEIEIRVYDRFYCKHCLEQMETMKSSKYLIKESNNWAVEMKSISQKYKGKINVINIIE